MCNYHNDRVPREVIRLGLAYVRPTTRTRREHPSRLREGASAFRFAPRSPGLAAVACDPRNWARAVSFGDVPSATTDEAAAHSSTAINKPTQRWQRIVALIQPFHRQSVCVSTNTGRSWPHLATWGGGCYQQEQNSGRTHQLRCEPESSDIERHPNINCTAHGGIRQHARYPSACWVAQSLHGVMSTSDKTKLKDAADAADAAAPLRANPFLNATRRTSCCQKLKIAFCLIFQIVTIRILLIFSA